MRATGRLLALLLGVGLVGAAAPAAYAASAPKPITLSEEAPAGTTQVWADLEGADPADVELVLTSGTAAPQTATWAPTVSGAGFRAAAVPGKLTATVTATDAALATKPVLALTFADEAGAVLDATRIELKRESDGSGTDGSGTDGSGTDGSGTDGSGTDGSGTDDAGTGGAKPGSSGGKGSGPLATTGDSTLFSIGILAALLLLGGGAAFAIRTAQTRRALAADTTDTKEPRA